MKVKGSGDEVGRGQIKWTGIKKRKILLRFIHPEPNNHAKL